MGNPKVHRPSGVAGGDLLIVESGGEIEVKSGGVVDIESGGAFKLAGVDKTSQLNLAIAGVAAGYKLARGVEASVTGTVVITSGLATVIAAIVVLADDPVVTEAMWSTVLIPAQTGGDAGKFTAKLWKPTAVADATPVAGTGTKKVAWIAIGT